MSETSKLYQPFELSGLQLANRVALAPMTRARAGTQRIPNELMAEYYAQRSGAGLVITEATTISAQANGWNESPGIYNDAMVDGWKGVTEAVHKAGSKVFCSFGIAVGHRTQAFTEVRNTSRRRRLRSMPNTFTRPMESKITKHREHWKLKN